MAESLLERIVWSFAFDLVGRLIPFRMAGVIARPAAAIGWRLAGRRRQVTFRNLAAAFPGLSMEEREELARATFRNLMTVFFELLPLSHLRRERFERHLRIENPELLREACRDGGALLLSGHVGNWELLALGAAVAVEVPFTVVVKRQRNHHHLERLRRRFGNETVDVDRTARRAASLLRQGGVVALLADQSTAPPDPFVPMFGIETCTLAAPARLALRFRPRVIVGFAERRGDGLYHVRLEEIRHDDLADDDDGVLEMTRRYALLLEASVRRHPEQWVWQHRRWKHTPGFHYDVTENAGG